MRRRILWPTVGFLLGVSIASVSAQSYLWASLNGSPRAPLAIIPILRLGLEGVQVTSDGDGAITFLGLGNGFDEDLTLNLDDTTNFAVLSSSTGVTTLALTAMGFRLSAATSTLNIGARSTYGASADKLIQVNDGGNTTGFELNLGTPTLGTCTGGTLTSGSHNFGGEITGNTSGSCVLNFGTPNFTNAPFCTLNDETNLVAARVSARSTSSITITGLTSGDSVQYLCFGGIGT